MMKQNTLKIAKKMLLENAREREGGWSSQPLGEWSGALVRVRARVRVLPILGQGDAASAPIGSALVPRIGLGSGVEYALGPGVARCTAGARVCEGVRGFASVCEGVGTSRLRPNKSLPHFTSTVALPLPQTLLGMAVECTPAAPEPIAQLHFLVVAVLGHIAVLPIATWVPLGSLDPARPGVKANSCKASSHHPNLDALECVRA